MSAEADIARRVLEGAARGRARRSADANALRAEIAAILERDPRLLAKQIAWLLPRHVTPRRIQQIAREIRGQFRKQHVNRASSRDSL